ncbi:apyrase-like [Thrips palmi]|uniref:Apyrase-like n=1 Tax=Thrips palmi TaxID=161013 RepID=A0A6P8ZQ25_THRPL|nr:apyrase-like [Thrips palmi]
MMPTQPHVRDPPGGTARPRWMAATWATVLAVAVLAARLPQAAEAVQVVEAGAADARSLQIVHLNDFHARFEPVSHTAGACKEGDKCIGGLARVAKAIAAERERNPQALVLNGGDNFQGTLWFSLFKGSATAQFMSELPWDALTIGNHEFDNGIAGLTPFLEKTGQVAPFVIANMDDSEEPRMHGLWQPSVVVVKNGLTIGIVGYIWKDTWTIATTEKLKFGDELEALDKEAERLKREQGVDIIVALSHAGLDVDLAVAQKTKYADVIVGAHSHTLLYNGPPPGGDHAYGPYPEVVNRATGRTDDRTVLVVQAAAYTKYLGNLMVTFDEQGEVASWSGNPIYMDSDLPQDEAMLQEMQPWKEKVEARGHVVVGSTLVELDKMTHDCYSGECTLGNFVADAMLDYVSALHHFHSTRVTSRSLKFIRDLSHQERTFSFVVGFRLKECGTASRGVFADIGMRYQSVTDPTIEKRHRSRGVCLPAYKIKKGPEGTWTAAAIAFTNAGGLRTNISPGNITYADMVAAQPFASTIDLVELQGKHLKELLEDNVEPNSSLLHWAGLRVKYDASKPSRQRVLHSEVLCAACRVPTYEPIQDDQWYTIASSSFIVEGGDNFVTFTQNLRNRQIGRVDIDLFVDYLQVHSPIMTAMDGRLVVLNSDKLQRRVRARRMRREPLIFY